MYHLLVIVVAALAVVRGYRRGLTGQVTSVLGLAFGVVCAHIFIPAVSPLVAATVGGSHMAAGGEYLATNLAGLLIYGVIYLLFNATTRIIRAAMSNFGNSLLDSVLGALFCMCNYLLMLSMLFNVAVGWTPDGPLMHDARADDGNVVSLVIRIAPPTLGAESFDDFAHEVQLREAKKISRNFGAGAGVMEIGKNRTLQKEQNTRC